MVICSSCSTTKFLVTNFTYDEVWDASLEVMQSNHRIQTRKISFIGIPTFIKKIDKNEGVIHLALTYPPFGDRITKCNIYSQSDLSHTISIRSINHSMFYVGPSRDQNYEEKLIDQIKRNLFGE